MENDKKELAGASLQNIAITEENYNALNWFSRKPSVIRDFLLLEACTSEVKNADGSKGDKLF